MKTALITGGSRGIGAACVRAFRQAGWQTAFFYRQSREAAEALVRETGAIALQCDVADSASVRRAVQEAGAYLPHVDALINNAGIASQELLTDAMLTLQNAEHDVERIQRDRKRLDGDREACQSELEALSKRREQTLAAQAVAKADGQAAEGEIACCERRLEEARELVSQTELSRDQKQKELKEIQGEMDAAQQLLGHETERMHRQELALGRIRAELSQLNDRLWNTYELSYAGAVEALEEYDRRREADTPAPGETLAAAFDENAADDEARRIRDRIRAMGAVNVGAIEEYASTKERFDQLEATRDELENKIAAEKLAKPRITEEQLRFFLDRFRKLDVRQLSHRRMLIDTFVNAVFLYDDKLVLTYNFREGTETITFDDLKNKLGEGFSGSDMSSVAAPNQGF